ncbi:hypothetical protein H2200_004300 [Cladophialophora chaetospira]|uniref:Xylanolytic transcriptional activator regulatory domain-containing protein n=1 Tax=Cladophialophora chaetospira TaxID=386627 RepID=A0AA39CJC5_9EURO|nr:hypothetical protein H2200_004300 [Cladophialophora chaetospira]
MASPGVEVHWPPSSPKSTKTSPRNRQTQCLECRRTDSQCDGVRPVCSTCATELGLKRCWIRSARRRRQTNIGRSNDIGSLVIKRSDPAKDLRVDAVLFQDVSRRKNGSNSISGEGTFKCCSPSHDGLVEHSQRLKSATTRIPTSYATSMNLVHLFFEKIQPWMPIFHQSTLLKFCAQRLHTDEDALQDLNLQDQLLFLGIFAMSARYSPLDASISAFERSEQFGIQAKKTYDQARDEVEPNLTFLQGCILLAFYYYTSGLSAQGWVIVGVCIRLSYDLGLHEIDEEDEDEASQVDPTEIEERRRSWWLVWELDCFGSTVLQRPFAIDQRRWNVRLPMSDESWFAGRVEYCEVISWEPGEIWRALIGIGTHDERACFLVANVMLSLVIDRIQQKQGVSMEEKITIENDINCVMLALPPAFDLNAHPPMFDSTSFGRCNWIVGTHLLLAATTCLTTEIKVNNGSGQTDSPRLVSSQSTGLAHMLRLATIIRNWSPDYISLAHPFLAYALAPILGSEPASVRSAPPYPSFYNLATLVQRRFAEKWKVGDIAIDIAALREKTDSAQTRTNADTSGLDLTKRYPLYFSSFYKPQGSPSPKNQSFLQDSQFSTP